MSILEELKFKFQQGNAIIRIIMVNVAVFIVFGVLNSLLGLFNSNGIIKLVLDWLVLPASFSRYIYQPWSLLTYTFLHEGFLHILFNMLWFYWIGQLLQQYLGNPKTYQAYFMGAIAGGLVYMVSYHVFPYLIPSVEISTARGASAGVLSVVFATATLLPEYELSLFLIGSVRLKYIALFTLLLDLISIPYDNPGGHIAHIGGAAFGYFYIKQIYANNFLSGFFDWIENLFKPKEKSNLKIHHRSGYMKVNSNEKPTQAEVDRILEKINQKGLSYLSDKEKDILRNFGKDN
jgi:membrane associated rhomboid family serine protease